MVTEFANIQVKKATGLIEQRITARLMGCVFELIVGHIDEEEGAKLLQEGIDEIKRI